VTNAKINDSFAMLIAVKKNEAQAMLLNGLEMKWIYDNHCK